MYLDLCLCSLVEKLKLPPCNSKVTIMMHIKEWLKLTNSGKLLPLVMDNCDIIIKGEQNPTLNNNLTLSDDYENLVLFTAASTTLTADYVKKIKKPINLIVPDGTWKQANKILRKEKSLIGLPRIKLENPKKSGLYIRKHPVLENISTIEAIAAALSLLEGDVYKKNLLLLFEDMMKKLYKRKGMKID